MNRLKNIITLLRKSPLTLILAIVSCLFLLLLLGYFIIAALGNGINMDTYAADGTFQLYNPMRRLLAGQIIGHDFPFFHGVGVPLLHYPVFYVMGHNVFAAETAKWLVSGLLFLASTLLFFFAFFKHISKALIASAAFSVLALYCIDVVYPGNSLVGVRTTFPVLVGAFILWQPSIVISIASRKVNLYPVILFTLLGLTFACGTEQGLATIIAYLILRLIAYMKSGSAFKQWWWRYGVEGLGTIATVFIILSIFTLGHAGEALHYALIDVPKDQGWYFGAPPNGYLAWNTFYYILNERVLTYLAPVIIGGTVLSIIAIKFNLASQRERNVIYFFLLYGVIVFAASVTGYWAPEAQLIPLTRVLGLVGIGLGINLLMKYAVKPSKIGKKRGYYYIGSIVILVILGGIVTKEAYLTYQKITDYHIKDTLKSARIARHADDIAYLSPNWRNRVDAFIPHIPRGSTIWSTYTSVYDSVYGQLNGSRGGEDYIIHALGQERRDQYTEDFIKQQPDFVITLKPTYFPYEEWLWDRHWSFYKQLISHYEIITDNGSHFLWRRLNTASQPQAPAIPVQKDKSNKYTLNTTGPLPLRMYEVTVKYSINKPVPLGDKVSRYILETDGATAQHIAISLPPYLREWKFPVFARKDDTSISLTPHTYGLGLWSNLNIESVSYSEVPLSKPNGFIIYDDYCSFGGEKPFYLRCKANELNLNYYLNESNDGQSPKENAAS